MRNNLSDMAEPLSPKESPSESEAREPQSQYERDISFLSRSAMAFFDLPPGGEIFQLIVDLHSRMTPSSPSAIMMSMPTCSGRGPSAA